MAQTPLVAGCAPQESPKATRQEQKGEPGQDRPTDIDIFTRCALRSTGFFMASPGRGGRRHTPRRAHAVFSFVGPGRGMNGWRDFRTANNWDMARPGREVFDLILSIAQVTAILGGNYFSDYLPPSSGWLVWDKGQRDFSLADGEMCWTNRDKAMRIFTYPRAAMLSENGLHPTQKPVSLMEWCIVAEGEGVSPVLQEEVAKRAAVIRALGLVASTTTPAGPV